MEEDFSDAQQSDSLKRAKLHQISAKLNEDLTRISTQPQPQRRPPIPADADSAIHETHEVSSALLNDQHQKEEDRWDKFLECFLFFCCVG